jgi:glycosyltransferase domain-containing protein
MSPAQADMASKLTIVLTLKDRPEFTRRWMQYMNDQRCPYKILIADGGADKAIEDQLRNSSNYPNLDYEYIRYPFDENVRVFYTKQLDVCGRVRTEYLLWADNDDFFLIDKIPLLIDFLDGNPDYSGCRGTYAQFSLLSKDGDVISAPVGERYTAVPSERGPIENEKYMERAECFFHDVAQYDLWLNWYCVFRTDKVRSTLETIYKYNFSDIVLNEILLHLLLLREGKIKVLDQLYYARQLGTSQGSAGIHAENNLLELFLINDVFHHFNNFILQENMVVGEGERARILKAFSYFIGMWCNGNYHPEPLVREPPVKESPVKVPLVKENFTLRCKRIIKQNEMLYFLARKVSHLFRNSCNTRKSQLDIGINDIGSQPGIGIPVVESQPGIRIPVIESYVLKSESERLRTQ